MREACRKVLEKLSGLIKGASFLDREILWGFDGVMIRKKKIITYCIIKEINDEEVPTIKVSRKLLRTWDNHRSLFGQVPLIVIVETPTKTWTKRVSASWEAEYEVDTYHSLVTILPIGYKELE